MVDYSDDTGFTFGFTCGLCGYEWVSDRVAFNQEEARANLNEVDLKMLWDECHGKAFEAAREDAAIEFNKCPRCGTWVCDECFYVTGEIITDLCTNCIEEIK